MALRQPVLQYLEAAAAVTGARDHDLTIDGDAPLVFDRGGEPGGIRVVRMGGDGKAEFRRADRRQLAPIGPGVFRAEDPVVVLAPDDFRPRGAARQQVDVLDDRVLALLRRHVLVVHAVIDDLPRGARVGARPQARTGYADADVRRVARIDQYRIDAGLLAAGDTEPLPALGHKPERLVQ